MALAILEALDIVGPNLLFHIDTGTNRYYQLKIGRDVHRRDGLDWVDGVYFTTPVHVNRSGGDLFNSSQELTIAVPAARLEKGIAYAQLFSFKTTEGKSPAFSRVVKVHPGLGILASGLQTTDVSPTLSLDAAMNTLDTFEPTRRVPCQTYGEVYAHQASFQDILAGIVKVAGPVLQNLMSGGTQAVPNGTGTPNENAKNAGGLPGILTTLLDALLKGLGGPAVSQGQSLGDNRFLNNGWSQAQSDYDDARLENRFGYGQNAQYSTPFIFGIDDALIASLAGPVLQILPQLLNSANQHRLQMKQENNKLTTNILAGINQRLLMQQLQDAQRQATANGQSGQAGDLNQLIQLMQQSAAAAPPAGTTAGASSLSLNGSFAMSANLSKKAVVSFVTGDPITWNGMQKAVFARDQPLQFKIRLSVVEPAPKKPLPKAILKFCFKSGADKAVLYEKTFKQKNLQANSEMMFSFTPDELSRLPVNQLIHAYAEMRWLAPATGNERRALGSTEVVLVNKYYLKEPGQALPVEQELTDMKRFRAFWNKIWESPALDAANGTSRGQKKILWALDLNNKYSILLSPKHESNGLMETKLLPGPVDPESLTASSNGRMKSGIELSISELNKLIPLWNGAPALDREHLEAFQTEAFAKDNSGDFVHNFKLKGKARERGMVWVVPIFKLFEFTLNTVQKTDDTGQVTAVAEEKVHFPLPVSARLLGLKSQA